MIKKNESNIDYFYTMINTKIKNLGDIETVVKLRERLHQLLFEEGKTGVKIRETLAEEFTNFSLLSIDEQLGIITSFTRSDVSLFSDLYSDTLDLHNYIYEYIFDFADKYGLTNIKLRAMRQRERLLKPFQDDFIEESFIYIEEEQRQQDVEYNLDNLTIGEAKEFKQLLEKFSYFKQN
jgi:hypothetical protein